MKFSRTILLKKILVKILFAENLKIKEVKNYLLKNEPIILFLNHKDYIKKNTLKLLDFHVFLELPIEILSFKDKYQSDAGSAKGGMASASRIIPAPISFEKTKEIQQLATKIFRLLGCAGVSRLDFLMNDKTEEVYFNEINTIPGSLSFYLWEKSGLSF